MAVSQKELEQALAPWAGITLVVIPGLTPAVPNIQIQRTGGSVSMAESAWHRTRSIAAKIIPFLPPPPPNPQAAAAAAAVIDAFKKTLARTLMDSLILESDLMHAAVIGTDILLDEEGLPRENRFGVMSGQVWDLLCKRDPNFAMAMEVYGGKLWSAPGQSPSRYHIWYRLDTLEHQAVLFHASALQGGIFPDSPGRQVARAGVYVRLVRPEAIRALRWKVLDATMPDPARITHPALKTVIGPGEPVH